MHGMREHAPARLPWLLVAGSALLAVLFAYVLFAGYVPARKRIAELEAELRAVYAREADLQAQLAERERRDRQRDAQVKVLRAERGALARQVQALERRVEQTRSPRRR